MSGVTLLGKTHTSRRTHRHFPAFAPPARLSRGAQMQVGHRSVPSCGRLSLLPSCPSMLSSRRQCIAEGAERRLAEPACRTSSLACIWRTFADRRRLRFGAKGDQLSIRMAP